LTMVLFGQLLRSWAMYTAASNFNHHVQSVHRADHVLVTKGVYSVFRHPSYTGFFYWAVGTQVMMANPVAILAFAVVMRSFFKDRIEFEEETLVEFFGVDKYGGAGEPLEEWAVGDSRQLLGLSPSAPDNHHVSSTLTPMDTSAPLLSSYSVALGNPDKSSRQATLKWSGVGYQLKGKTLLEGANFLAFLEDLALGYAANSMVSPSIAMISYFTSARQKTTFLNALSGRLTEGKVEGEILFNGEERNSNTWTKDYVMVEQDDEFYSNLTVGETVGYTAKLKVKGSDEKKRTRATETLQQVRSGTRICLAASYN
ncbi:hypothetical protein HDU93_001833, partial [Gonapodya sp. JEL0774]